MWAFSDESERAGVMLFAVVLVAPGDVDTARASLRGLLLAGQRRVHTAKESPRRRRVVLDTVARTHGLTATVVRFRRPAGIDHVAGRRLLIQAAAATVTDRAVTAWTLDDMHPAERARDRDGIAHTLKRLAPTVPVVYDHRRSHTEPLLWAADAICWATGAGGDWKRRIDPIVTVVDIGP